MIAGQVDGVQGAVTEIAADPTYVDVHLPAGAAFDQPVPRGHTAFAYVYQGEGFFGVAESVMGTPVPAPRLLMFEDGDTVQARTIDKPLRFLLVSGKPLYEPIARYGPFVMNTQEEIQQALLDLRNGTFVMR